jgi:hypothetical protein
MALTESSSNSILSKRNFLGFRFKKSTPKQQPYPQHDASYNTNINNNANTRSPRVSPDIPRQAHNPAIHPLLAKPIAREENFVLLPHRNVSSKRKRDPNSPVRSSIKPKPRDEGFSEWNRYLSSYAEVKHTHVFIDRLQTCADDQGRFNMSNPPEPPESRPSGHLKAPIPTNDKERVEVFPLKSLANLGVEAVL